MIKMTECKFCKCKPVCKHQEQWSKYCEEHISLRKESVLFDCEPVCKYYIEDVSIKFGNDNEFSNRLRELGDAEKIISNMINQEDEDNKETVKTLENISSKPVSIRFDSGSEIKTIPCDGNTRGKRADIPILYFDYEECPENILESPYIKAKLNDDKYKDSIEILRSLVKSINEANKLRN